MSLDIGLLIAGARERGELEARVTRLIKDVKKSGEHIFWVTLKIRKVYTKAQHDVMALQAISFFLLMKSTRLLVRALLDEETSQVLTLQIY